MVKQNVSDLREQILSFNVDFEDELMAKAWAVDLQLTALLRSQKNAEATVKLRKSALYRRKTLRRLLNRGNESLDTIRRFIESTTLFIVKAVETIYEMAHKPPLPKNVLPFRKR